MARRKLNEPRPDPDWMDKSRAGTKVRIRGERGTFTVLYEAGEASPHGLHVQLFGGPHDQYRTPAADLVVWPRQPRRRRTEEH